MSEHQPPTFVEEVDVRHPGTDGYDAVPRDGPAIFVAYDDGTGEIDQPLRGRWIDLRLGEAALAAELSGHPSAAGWSIVDQLECGPLMVPEQPTPGELRGLIAWAQTRRPLWSVPTMARPTP